MRRAVVLLFLLIAAPAGAAPLVERPFEPRPGIATCLRATGVPGGLAILGPLARRDSPVDLLTAGADGTSLEARVRLGALADCAAVAEAPGGAAVVAASVSASRTRLRSEVRAAVRDPGGAFGAPVRLGPARVSGPAVAAAVSPSGHAVVAWVQGRTSIRRVRGRARIMAARRAPGGAFEPAQPLTAWGVVDEFDELEVVADMDAAGNATMAWTRQRSRSGIVEVASAAPGRPFEVQDVTVPDRYASSPALAVAADGWALLAHDNGGKVRVLERPPGASRFTEAPIDVPPRSLLLGTQPWPAVAVRDGGGAVVAWRTEYEIDSSGLAATVRPAAGTFARPRRLAPTVANEGATAYALLVLTTPFAPSDLYNGRLRAALAPDGRALLGWTVRRPPGPVAPMAALGTLDDGFGAPTRPGSPIRHANGIASLFLRGGQAALAWTDNAGAEIEDRHANGDGRLHLAVEGAPPVPAPPRPRVTLTAPRTQRLFRSQPVRATVGCDRACDLRVTRRVTGPPITLSLRAAGRRRLSLDREPAFDQRPSGSERVRVHASAPGGSELATDSVAIRVIDRPSIDVPAPQDVRARRRGRTIVVSWRTAVPARRAGYAVEARRARRRTAGRDFRSYAGVRGRGRTRFTARIRPRRPGTVRWVRIAGYSLDDGANPRPVFAPVSGGRSSA